MQANVALISEINELRREIKNLRHAATSSKPGAGIGASWGEGKGHRRVSKEAKEPLPPPPGYVGDNDCSPISVGMIVVDVNYISTLMASHGTNDA